MADQIRYALQLFENAVLTLASSEASLEDRLTEAWKEIRIASRQDFPAPISALVVQLEEHFANSEYPRNVLAKDVVEAYVQILGQR